MSPDQQTFQVDARWPVFALPRQHQATTFEIGERLCREDVIGRERRSIDRHCVVGTNPQHPAVERAVMQDAEAEPVLDGGITRFSVGTDVRASSNGRTRNSQTVQRWR